MLGAIGLVHALLLRNGDILLPYAIMGFILLPFRRASDGSVLATALLVLLVPFAARSLWEASGLLMPARPVTQEGGFLAVNLAWVRYWYTTAILHWPPILTLFLFGFYAGRHHLVTRLAERPAAAAWIFIGALAASALLFLLQQRVLAGFPEDPTILADATASLLFSFHAWTLAVAYMAALLLALRTAAGSQALRPLAAVGRMALTGYLMQAALIVPFCLLLGLFGRFTPASSLLLALTFFLLVQLPFAVLWLRQFEFGPAEWLWRRLTYGGSLPMGAARRRSVDRTPVT